MSVSLVAHPHGIGAGQLFTWRRLMAQGALTAAGAGEEVVPASEYRALQAHVSELQRLLGKKTMAAEILREAVCRGRRPKKTAVAFCLIAQGRSVTAVADAIGISRQHLSAMHHRPAPKAARATAAADAELVADIRALITNLLTYGYRRVHALLRRQAEKTGRTAPNPKRVYRVMKAHGLLLQPHSGKDEERRHDRRVAVDQSNARWCSDALEIGCDIARRLRPGLLRSGSNGACRHH